MIDSIRNTIVIQGGWKQQFLRRRHSMQNYAVSLSPNTFIWADRRCFSYPFGVTPGHDAENIKRESRKKPKNN